MNFIELETAQKLRGGYYTPKYLADFICSWVLETKPKTLLEPSCGDGVFFKSLSESDRSKSLKISGFEILDEEALKAKDVLLGAGLHNSHIFVEDFIKWSVQNFNSKIMYDSVVGNPPFIRYQYLENITQEYIESIFNSLGLKFKKHTNLWVPFILSSINFLSSGGRLGMVVPSEILHVMHAQPLRSFLGHACSKVLIFDPEDLWFKNTLQGAVILFAEKKKNISIPSKGLGIIKTNGNGFTGLKPKTYFQGATYINGKTVEGKWTYALLTKKEYDLLEAIRKNDHVYKFSDVASVDVGIVTGANKYFLVNDEIITAYNLQEYSHPMFGRSDHCPGLIYNDKQQQMNKEKGLPTNFLWFNVDSVDSLSRLQKKYIQLGEEEKINERYKCRIRSPWFKVPSVHSTEIGMLKRAHDFPRLILNNIGAYTTDTAYRIKIKMFTGSKIVSIFINSLTALTAELEGRHYGGGVLELVPSEIEKLLLPVPENINENLEHLNNTFLDKTRLEFLREQDQAILSSIGLSIKEIEILRGAWVRLRYRRQRKPNLTGLSQ